MHAIRLACRLDTHNLYTTRYAVIGILTRAKIDIQDYRLPLDRLMILVNVKPATCYADVPALHRIDALDGHVPCS